MKERNALFNDALNTFDCYSDSLSLFISYSLFGLCLLVVFSSFVYKRFVIIVVIELCFLFFCFFGGLTNIYYLSIYLFMYFQL